MGREKFSCSTICCLSVTAACWHYPKPPHSDSSLLASKLSNTNLYFHETYHSDLNASPSTAYYRSNLPSASVSILGPHSPSVTPCTPGLPRVANKILYHRPSPIHNPTTASPFIFFLPTVALYATALPSLHCYPMPPFIVGQHPR